MSLATRCTACGTVFRVVQDQLRVSSGWVRCGRCGEVFNAIESLVDMGVEDRSEAAPTSAHASRVMDTLARVAGASAQAEVASAGTERNEAVVPEFPAEEPSFHHGHPPGTGDGDEDAGGVAVSVPGREPAAEAATPPDHDAAEGMPHPPTMVAGSREVEPPPVIDSGPGQTAPRFVRQAEQEALWRRPGVRAIAATGCVTLAALLGWQAHADGHDWLVAQWPALRPLSLRLCEIQGCSIEPLRRLEGLVVESSALTKTEVAGVYRLALTIRNRSDTLARMPAVDLVLSDATGRPMVRSVLRLRDLGLVHETLAPTGQAQVAARLRVDAPAVVGYTIELFYP